MKLQKINEEIKLPIANQAFGIAEIKGDITDAKDASELVDPATKLSLLNQEYTSLQKEFKLAVKTVEEKSKAVKAEIAETTKLLKAKAIEIVKVEQVAKSKASTGEIYYKTTHNLDTKLFSYTPPKKEIMVDTDEILANPDKYQKFLKVEYKLDLEKIAAASASELPQIEKNIEPRIALKKAKPQEKVGLIK